MSEIKILNQNEATATIKNLTKRKIKVFKWWHAVLIYIFANITGFIIYGFSGDKAFYNSFQLPDVAPPDWLFAPMWFVLNITSLIALYTIANLPNGLTNRKSILVTETINWVLYTIFALLYFGLRSSVFAAVDTLLSLIVTCLSIYWSYKISIKAFWFLFPRLLWLLLATYVSTWAALHNQDPFLLIGPYL